MKQISIILILSIVATLLLSCNIEKLEREAEKFRTQWAGLHTREYNESDSDSSNFIYDPHKEYIRPESPIY